MYKQLAELKHLTSLYVTVLHIALLLTLNITLAENASAHGTENHDPFTLLTAEERAQPKMALSPTQNMTPVQAEMPDDEHGQSDLIWAEKAQSYPPFVVDQSKLVVATETQLNQLGQWGPVIQWPHIPVSAANLPDGRIVSWASWGIDRFGGNNPNISKAAIWDPSTGQFQNRDHNNHDMFCAGLSMLEDGRVVASGGGRTIKDTTTFDFNTNNWTKVQNMQQPRWYNTNITLPGDQVFSALGNGANNIPEIWTESQGWRSLPGINLNPILNSPGFEVRWWPYLHVAPNGKLFHSGPTYDMHYIDTSGNGSIQNMGRRLQDNWYPKHANAVMYDEGKILLMGGAPSTANSGTTNKALTIDINGTTPQVTQINSMTHPRRFHTSVILPNGEVLVIGGNTSGAKFSDAGTVLTPEIWNPSTGQWNTLADMSVPRNYHSIALLMTDGRVLSGGGGLCGNCSANHLDGQVFTPPYLFNPDGSLATRPVISQGPNSVRHNQNFTLQATANLQKFSLIKMSSTTHGVNTDMRYIDVPFTETTSGQYQLTTHANPNVLTPGYYMLFAVNAQGVPSVAKVIQVTTAGSPQVTNPGDQTHSEGDSISLAISATDPDNDPLTYSAIDLPPGLSINPSTGLISGILAPGSGGSYNVTVLVDDGAGGVGISFMWIVLPEGRGQILREWWTGISGVAISNLTSNGNYPDSPTGSDIPSSFEAPTDWADNYGTRMRGYLYPPTTGLYTFWIASDDHGELWLSTDENPANITRIAYVPSWSSPRQWDKFGEQQSTTISLVAGERYYIEALQKEGGGLDNLAVAWQVPGGSREVIDGLYLSLYNGSPSVTSPGNQGNSTGDTVSLTIIASDPEGDPLTYVATNLPAGLTIDGSTGVISGTPTTPGSNNVTVTINDNSGGSDETSFTWTVVQSNQPPVITNPSTQNSTEGDAISLQIIASDPDNDPIFYSATNLPTGLSINFNTGEISGILPTGSVGTYTVDLLVTDGTDDTALVFTWIVVAPAGNWVDFTEEAASRLTITSITGNDDQEKDMAVGDLDKDGWDDVVVVRKNPFTAPGVQSDLLLMNINGVLTDQTSQYAAGFLANPTDARDVLIADLDGDTWLDVLVASTFEDPPALYHNLGEDGNGDWLGLAEESNRLPATYDTNTVQFCSVTAGDVNNDGALDLYFTNYSFDIGAKDVLLINDGNGNFTNESQTRLGNLRQSAFGNDVQILDIDQDGDRDVVKLSADYSVAPWNSDGLFILFNDGSGNFSNYQTVPTDDAYMFKVADLNNDGTQDIFVQDDAQDSVNFGSNVVANTSIDFTRQDLTSARTANRGGNTKLADLDNDGDLDIGVADVDSMFPPCDTGANSLRKFTLLQNQGNASGTLVDPYGGLDKLWHQNTFDFAFIDINRDGNMDILAAQCTGYAVYINSASPLNSPPTLTNPGDQTHTEGDVVSLTLNATDPESDPLTFSASNLPDGLSIDPNTGEIAGTLSNSSANSYNVIVTVSDGTFNDSANFTWTVNEPISTCGGLVQEGEDGTLFGAFVLGSDSAASNGQYAHVPSSLGNFNTLDPANRAEYCFTVATAGTYRIESNVHAASAGTDSFHFTIDGAPVAGYVWDAVINSSYQSDFVSARGAGDPFEITLAAGEHTVIFYPRESGARIDTLTLELVDDTPPPPPPCSGLIQEGEDGTLAGGFQIGNDATASNGQFVHSPTSTSDVGGNTSAAYCVQIDTPGTYRIKTQSYAPDLGADTFYVTIDGQPAAGYIWDVAVNTTYGIDYVSGRGGIDPVEVTLSAGEHTVIFYPREAGARLDSLEFELVGGGNTTCGGLLQEAEAGTLGGAFQVASDTAASGGEYVVVPSGSGTSGVGSADNVSYCMTVPTAGTYRLKAWAYTPDAASNSYHVQIDGQPTNGYTWHIPVNAAYASYNVTSGGAPVEVALTAGDHVVTFFMRERNARLDKVELELVDNTPPPPPPVCSPGLSAEGEDGALSGGFVVGNDAAASGGQFAHVPGGYGNRGAPDANEAATYCLTVATAGTYRIKTQIDAPNGADDSFFVEVDSQSAENFKWHILNTTGFEERYVAIGGSTTPVEFTLTPGEHTVTFFLREDGVALDTVELEFVGTSAAQRLAADAGINYTYFEVEGDSAAAQANSVVKNSSVVKNISVAKASPMDGTTAIESGILQNISLAPRYSDRDYALAFNGCIAVPSDGAYTFFAQSDDITTLSINGQPLVEIDGRSGMEEAGGEVTLTAGRHALSVLVREYQGYGEGLRVSYQGPDLEKQSIPDTALFVEGCQQVIDNPEGTGEAEMIFLPFVLR